MFQCITFSAFVNPAYPLR